MTKKGILWSPSRYDTAASCLMRYYYNYIERVPYQVGPDLFIGKLLHQRIENFYFPVDYRVKKRRLKPKIEDPEEFAKKTANIWMRKVKLSEESQLEQPIKFTNKDTELWQWYWIANKLALEIHNLYFNREPPPLVEYRFPRTYFMGQSFWGILDQGDTNFDFVDHKFKRYPSKEEELKQDTQNIIYGAIVSLLCSSQDESHNRFKDLMQLSKEDQEQALLDPWYMYKSDKIKFAHQWGNTGWVEKGEKREFKKLVSPPKEFQGLVKIINNAIYLEDKINKKEFPTNPGKDGRNCSYCFFRDRCTVDHKTKTIIDYKVEPTKKKKRKKSDPMPNQMELGFAKPIKN
ncbi:MAG: PD-(D/E)XK nuclease family protein [Candidatus Nanoarchaeia archaeon]|nr:PD-(D/E)XK nuclease family protein [Candidatus Nanoarchaeia archaeon]